MVASTFIDELHGKNPFLALESFLKEIEKDDGRKRIILDFLTVSPKCDDILHLLRGNQLTTAELATVFDVLRYILMSLAEDGVHDDVHLHITRWVLQNHSEQLVNNLYFNNTSTSPRLMASTIYFIAGMVMSSSVAAQEVLTHLDMDHIGFSRLASSKSKSRTRDIRTPMVFLVLAFLNSNENSVLKRFIENVDLVTSIFKGLPSDPSEIVIKVLTLLHEAVVMNMRISKTLKIKVFNPSSCKFLMNLYFHRCPEDMVKNSYSLEEEEKIRETLHRLMITLCSDSKHGVVFKHQDAQQLKGVKSTNTHISLILSTLKQPWEFEEGRELICRAAAVCADLPKLLMQGVNRNSLIKPKTNEEFLSLWKFVILLHDKYEPWRDLERQIQTDHIKVCKFVIFPLSVGIIHTLIENESLVLRHAGTVLLLTICNKAKETISRIDQMTMLSNPQKSDLKAGILEELERICKGVMKVTNQWISCLSTNDHAFPQWYRKECPTKFVMLADIACCLCLLGELYGFSYIRESMNPVKRLNEILDLHEDNCEENESYQKVVKLIMELLLMGQRMNNFECSGFLIDRERVDELVGFNETLFLHFVNVYCRYRCDHPGNASNGMKKDLQDLSLKLLSGSLDTWGLSSYCENKVTVWLDHIVPRDQKSTNFLAKVITKSISNYFLYLDLLLSCDPRYQMKNYNTIQLIESLSQAEPKDNKDIDLMRKEVTIPFACLILAGIDVLKEDPAPNLVKYFSSVVEDYITFIEHPHILAEHLLENEDILTLETKQYLRAFVLREFVNDVSISEDRILAKLKNLFMTGNYPHASHFCNEYLNQTGNCDQLISVCRHVLLHLQSKHKKTRKFSLGILKNFLNNLQTESDFENVLGMFEYLVSHPFILASYRPFTSSDAIHIEVEKMVSLIIENYPTLHHTVRPFLEKAITELKCVSLHDIEVWNSVSIYLSKYTLLTYVDIERLVDPLLSASLPYSESHIHLLTELLQLFIAHTRPSHQPSEELTNLFLSKMIAWSQRKDFSEQDTCLITLVSSALFVCLNSEKIQNLKPKELTSLFACRPLNSELCCQLIRVRPSIALHLPKRLLTNVMTTSGQATFIVELLKMEKFSKDHVHSWLIKRKEGLVEWVLSFTSEMNDAYRDILAYMIKNNMFEKSDIKQMRSKFFDEIVASKRQLPSHILSIIPLYTVSTTEKEDPVIRHPSIQLFILLLHGLTVAYKKSDGSISIAQLESMIMSIILEKVDPRDISRELSHSKIWLNFVKQVLKQSLTDPVNGPRLLKLVIHLWEMIYKNASKKERILPPVTLYQMLRSHSQYIPIMFNQEEHEEIKEQLVLLQLQLVTYHPDVCEEKHVPILLGSYGATRSTTDQAILKLLYLYEDCGFMPTYEPTLWGPFAITYFAVEKGPGVSTMYKAPKHQQILSLLDAKKVIETALHFDTELGLEPDVLRGNDRSLYDQRFLLMLFTHFTWDNLEVDAMDLVEKGVLAIAVAALSSYSHNVWAVGATLLSDIVYYFKHTRFSNLSHQWVWFISIIAGGLEARKQRLPPLMAHFLVKASQLFSTPGDVMYKPVMNYLWLRPSFPLFQVPDMYMMLFSEDVEHNEEHRIFFLNLLASGIRDELDWNMCQLAYLPKYIMSIMTSAAASTRVRVLCLDVLKTMVEVPNAAQSLLAEHSLLVELPHALEPIHYCPPEHAYPYIDAVVRVLTSFWNTWKRTLNADSMDTLDTSPLSDPVSYRSGSKRKVEDTCVENINGNSRKAKKRKLCTGEVATGKVGKNAKIKEGSHFAVGCVQLFVCLEHVVPAVLSEGMVTTLAECFRLINEILICKHPRKSKVLQINNLMKQKVKSWIDNCRSSPKFGGYQTHAVDSTHQWKHKPLNIEVIVKKGDVEETREESDFKILSKVTEELLSLLNKS